MANVCIATLAGTAHARSFSSIVSPIPGHKHHVSKNAYASRHLSKALRVCLDSCCIAYRPDLPMQAVTALGVCTVAQLSCQLLRSGHDSEQTVLTISAAWHHPRIPSRHLHRLALTIFYIPIDRQNTSSRAVAGFIHSSPFEYETSERWARSGSSPILDAKR